MTTPLYDFSTAVDDVVGIARALDNRSHALVMHEFMGSTGKYTDEDVAVTFQLILCMKGKLEKVFDGLRNYEEHRLRKKQCQGS